MLEILTQRSMKYVTTAALRLQRVRMRKSNNQLKELVFSYGANLSRKRLEAKGLMVESLGSATARGYGLRFNVPCEYKGQGYAGLTKSKNENTWGVVIRTNKLSLLLLDILEWVPFHFYRREKISVTMGSDNTEVSVWAYIPCHPRENLIPSKAYRDFIYNSALENGAKSEDLAFISNHITGNVFLIDHEFNLWNPGRSRILGPNFLQVIKVSDRIREKIAEILP